MFRPRFRITSYLSQLLQSISTLQERIGCMAVPIQNLEQLEQHAFIKSTNASTTIEGNLLTYEQVEALSHNQPVLAESQQKKEVLNYFEALRWIRGNYHLPIQIHSILMLQKMLCSGLIPDSKLGKFKSVQNYVINGDNIVIYTPPPPEETDALMTDLVHWINAESENHPIIDSAIFHHQFVSIHPFSDGNGRLARLLSQWVLYRRKFDFNHLYSLDNYYAENRDRYYEKIDQTRELDFDFTHWIEYVAKGIESTLKELLTTIQQLSAKNSPPILYNRNQHRILALIQQNGALPSQAFRDALGISRSRVHQLLMPLIKDGIIGVTGNARSTHYYLKREPL